MDKHAQKVLIKVISDSVIMFIVFSIVMTVFLAKELGVVAAFSKPVDIQHEEIENFDDIEAVKTTLQMVFGRFSAEVTETTNRGTHGRVTYVDYYYAVAIENNGKRYYMAVKVADDDKAPYDELKKVTHQYMQGDNEILGTYTKSLEGSFAKMNNSTYQELKAWLRETDIITNEKELDSYVLPYVITETDLEVNKQFGYALIVSCVVGIVILIIVVIRRNKRCKSS